MPKKATQTPNPKKKENQLACQIRSPTSFSARAFSIPIPNFIDSCILIAPTHRNASFNSRLPELSSFKLPGSSEKVKPATKSIKATTRNTTRVRLLNSLNLLSSRLSLCFARLGIAEVAWFFRDRIKRRVSGAVSIVHQISTPFLFRLNIYNFLDAEFRVRLTRGFLKSAPGLLRKMDD